VNQTLDLAIAKVTARFSLAGAKHLAARWGMATKIYCLVPNDFTLEDPAQPPHPCLKEPPIKRLTFTRDLSELGLSEREVVRKYYAG